MYNHSPWTVGLTRRYDSLHSQEKADVAIVGGSFAGLAAAKYLMDAGCKSIIVLEGDIVGRASGRAAGLVTASTEDDFNEYLEEQGGEAAKTVWADNYASAQLVRKLAGSSIDGSGSIYLGKDENMEYYMEEARNRTANGFPAHFQSPPEIKAAGYDVSVFDPSDFSINTAAYCTGLAGTLAKGGVRIFENTMIKGVDRNGGVVYSSEGSVKAKKIVLAGQNVPRQFGSNGATVPMATYCIATEPLTDAQIRSIGMENSRTFWNDSTDYRYGKMTKDNRLVFGGAYNHLLLDGVVRGRRLRQTEHEMRKLFPQLEDANVEFRWGGPIYSAIDELPVVERDGRVYMAGVSPGIPQATRSGRLVADMILGKETENLFAPRTTREMLEPKLRNPKGTLTEIKALAGF